MKQIPLTQGKYALVDDDDYLELSKYKWQAQRSTIGAWYAYRRESESGKRNGRHHLMHRDIMNAGKGQIVDHKNGDGLDNQRNNLRFCSAVENARNSAKRRCACTSSFKGVYLTASGRFCAEIFDGTRIIIGRFDTELEAADAYNRKAVDLFGEFARLNSIEMKAYTKEQIQGFIEKWEKVAKRKDALVRGKFSIHRYNAFKQATENAQYWKRQLWELAGNRTETSSKHVQPTS